MKVAFELLHKLATLGVIAGGGVLYGMQPTILNLPSDVDVFISDPDAYREAHKLVRSSSLYLQSKCYVRGSTCLNSIVNCVMKSEIYIQLIYKKFESPDVLIRGFDSTYVMCALHSGNLTALNQQEIETGDVGSMGDRSLRFRRFMKTVNKGFKIPLMYDGEQGRDTEALTVIVADDFLDNLESLKEGDYYRDNEKDLLKEGDYFKKESLKEGDYFKKESLKEGDYYRDNDKDLLKEGDYFKKDSLKEGEYYEDNKKGSYLGKGLAFKTNAMLFKLASAKIIGYEMNVSHSVDALMVRFIIGNDEQQKLVRSRISHFLYIKNIGKFVSPPSASMDVALSMGYECTFLSGGTVNEGFIPGDIKDPQTLIGKAVMCEVEPYIMRDAKERSGIKFLIHKVLDPGFVSVPYSINGTPISWTTSEV